jgi:hypothetical protein
MLAELTSRQIAEWHAFYNLEPFGWREEWRRVAMIAAVIANVNRGKATRPFRESDFMPPDHVAPAGPAKRQSIEEQRSIIASVLAPFKKKAAVEKQRKEG